MLIVMSQISFLLVIRVTYHICGLLQKLEQGIWLKNTMYRTLKWALHLGKTCVKPLICYWSWWWSGMYEKTAKFMNRNKSENKCIKNSAKYYCIEIGLTMSNNWKKNTYFGKYVEKYIFIHTSKWKNRQQKKANSNFVWKLCNWAWAVWQFGGFWLLIFELKYLYLFF